MQQRSKAARPWWLVPAGLVLLSLVPALGGTSRLDDLINGTKITADNARFVAMPLPIVAHIIAVLPFSMLGAFQFSAEFRRRHRDWHRMAGRLLVVLGLVAALSGLWMTVTYPWANNDGEAVYTMRLLMGCAMTAAILMGIDAIRRREFNEHGEWMTRAYAIGMGAGTQVFTHVPYFILVGRPTELPRAIMMAAGWIINMIVAELIIRRMRAQREQRAAHAASLRQTMQPQKVAHHAYGN